MIIFLPLHHIPSTQVEDPRTEDERTADLQVIRKAELRWAWYSMYSLVVSFLITLSVVLIWLGATGRWNGVQ